MQAPQISGKTPLSLREHFEIVVGYVMSRKMDGFTPTQWAAVVQSMNAVSQHIDNLEKAAAAPSNPEG